MEFNIKDLITICFLLSGGIALVRCDCEPGWHSYYDTCYYISDIRHNMNDLMRTCTLHNATLWSPHSKDEIERKCPDEVPQTSDEDHDNNDVEIWMTWTWVAKIVETGPRILYWTGLKLVNKKWTWSDGTPYQKNNVPWYQNREGNKNDANQLCAGMFSYDRQLGQFQQKRCRDGWGTICTRPKAMLDICDLENGWHFIDGVCLKYFDDHQTWQQARQICQTHQGDLTIFKNYDQLLALFDLIQCRLYNYTAWIGLSDTVVPRQWKWINNDTVRYSRWYPYHNRILQNGSTCAAADPSQGWSWKHFVCDTRLSFICNRSIGVCPTGWLQNQDRCYQPHSADRSIKTWFDAKMYCQSIGTSLLVINSDTEQQFISKTLNDLHITKSWIGLSDEAKSNIFAWVDGSSPTYIHWANNFPQPVVDRYDCGSMSRDPSDSRWANEYCFNMHPFFCEMKVTDVPLNPTTAPVTMHCDPNWVLFNNHCYYFGPIGNQTLKNWQDSRDYCRSSNGDLVVIEGPYEMAFIIAQQLKGTVTWIGMKYDKTLQQLMWVDSTIPGQQAAKETNFYPGEPDNITNGQECIQIVGGRRDYTGSWDDGDCNQPKSFICEKNAYSGSGAMTTTPTIPNVLSPYCGAQWVYNSGDNFCYQVVLNNPKSWSLARADCISRGGDLMSISGQREQNFIEAMLSTGQYGSIELNYWIGATDQTREGGWEWTDGSPFRLLHWYPGEPNNFLKGQEPENCAEIVSAWNYQWNDRYCSKEQLYICKKDAVMTTLTGITPPTGTPPSALCIGKPMISGSYSVDKDAFTASSSSDPQHLAYNSRYIPDGSGGWTAKTPDFNQNIAVSFYNTITVTGITTAGRPDNSQWVTHYTIQYQESYYADWITYQDPPGVDMVFTGNKDGSTPVTNNLTFPFEAQGVRLVPRTWHFGISLRWEVLGCFEEGCSPDYAISGPLVVKDSQLNASSVLDPRHDAPSARVRPIMPGMTPSCWKPFVSDSNQWIQVDLGNAMIIRGITTKGNPRAQEWVKSFYVKYSNKDLDSLYTFYQEPYGRAFAVTGNTDNVSPVTYYFKMHIQARYLRILPITWNSSIAMAFDVLVCNTGCHGVPLVSGTMPISDDQITASTMLDNNHAAFRARLNQASHGSYAGAWIPKYSDLHQYIQVDLGSMVHISAISTQGSFDSQDWVLTYKLDYSDDAKTWVSYYGVNNDGVWVFDGNWDNKVSRKQYMLLPFIARYIRIWPQTWHNRIAMRLEIYGCPGADSFQKLGCFADNSLTRDLPFEPFTDPRVGMWPPMCVHHCFRNGYYYAGIQDQFKCFCGNSYGRYGPATDCNLSCVPKNNYFCGGPSSNQIYSTGLTPQFKVCPPKWKGYLDQCYMLLLDTKSWYDAQADCKMLGGDLASPNDQHQQDFVFSLLQAGDGFHAWIGFNDIEEESFFQWSVSKQVKYTNWGLNQPSSSLNNQQDCVRMDAKTGGWESDTCDSVNQYVCQTDKRPTIQPSQATKIQGCPDGWTGYRASCYVVADAQRSWSQAKTVCQTLGANLVRVDDRYEQSYLASILGSKAGHYWTSITSRGHPGTYHYDYGSSLLSYSNWGPHQPAGSSSSESCVSLDSGGNAGLWLAYNCSKRLGSVCEQKRIGYTTLQPPPTTPPLPNCDPGLIQTDSACYQLNEQDKKSWDDARQDCMQKGGDLASFHSASQLNILFKNFSHGDGFWIGLNDRNTENSFTWSDNSAVNFVNFDIGEPNDYGGNEDCIVMQRSKLWNDNSCTTQHPWICMVKRGYHLATLPTVPIPTAGPSGMCDPGWSYYNSNCYMYVPGVGDNATTWRGARDACQINGGDLTSITSALENSFIYHVILHESKSYNWIGFSEISVINAGYRWSDRSPIKYINWKPGEPNDYQGQEDCAAINNGKWEDAHCSVRFGYVCKKFKGSLPTPAAPTSPWKGFCPAGYHMLYDRCYKIFTDKLQWGQAFDKCRSFGPGYTLASIRSEVENAFLVTLLADMHISPWIGMKATYGNTNYLWINNDDTTYTNFALGQPSSGNEKCVQMYGGNYQTGQWNDRVCSILLPYVCMVRRDSYITTPEPIPTVCDATRNQIQFLSNCYMYIQKHMTWTTARDYCKAQGAALTSITSLFEQSFIFVLAKQNNADLMWIGLNDNQNTGYYVWADAWPVVFTKWQKGEPTKGSGEGCVAFNTTGRWVDTECTQWLSFVCKISSAVPTLTPVPVDADCDPGWVSYTGKCYFFGLHRTFIDASYYCQRNNAKLVSIHNATVNRYLVNVYKKIPNHGFGFWTSLYKALDAGFAWGDGSPLQYTNWKPGEPNNFAHGPYARGENCMEVGAIDGMWNDEFCSVNRDFVCEKQIAVDNSQIHQGRTPSFSIPTPLPRSSPLVLPSQVTPTLKTRTGIVIPQSRKPGQPTYHTPYVGHSTRQLPYSVNTLVPPNWTPPNQGHSPGQSTITPSNSGGNSSQNSASPLQQTDDSKESSVSGGAIAGIVVGSLVVLIIAGGSVVVWRRKTPVQNFTEDRKDVGFDNQTYHFDHSNEEMNRVEYNNHEKYGLNMHSVGASESDS